MNRRLIVGVALVISILGMFLLTVCARSNNPWVLYHRTGGFTGFDDKLTLYRSGDSVLEFDKGVRHFSLDPAKLAELQDLIDSAKSGTKSGSSDESDTVYRDIRIADIDTQFTFTGSLNIPTTAQPLVKFLDFVIDSQAK